MDNIQRNIENRFYCIRNTLRRGLKMRMRCTRDGQLTSFVRFHASVTSGDVPVTFCGASSHDFAFVFSPRREAEGDSGISLRSYRPGRDGSGTLLGMGEKARDVVDDDKIRVGGVDIYE